jgi:hypothetical protein
MRRIRLRRGDVIVPLMILLVAASRKGLPTRLSRQHEMARSQGRSADAAFVGRSVISDWKDATAELRDIAGAIK